jgi:NhaP-type Na+/H+ and K+/H+ antiporter
MASAALVLGYFAIEAWHDGWAARIIAFLLFLTVPFVVWATVFDFRGTQNLDVLKKRVAWLGVSLAILGALELVLAIAEIFVLAVLSATGIY